MGRRAEIAAPGPRGAQVAPGVRGPSDPGALWDLAPGAVFLALALALCWTAIWTGFEIGKDEHYEVTKALLWAKGFVLYQDIWNDQQPLLTVLLGLLFKIFGAHAALARGLALLFGASLISGLFHFVRKSSGTLAGFVAVLSLLAAPHVFQLGVSAMNELPAYAVGLWALWGIRRWGRDGRTVWLVVSGLTLAAALELKLTAALLGPALGLELVLVARARSKAGKVAGIVRCGSIWGGSVLAGVVVLALLMGAGYGQAFGSHFSSVDPAVSSEIASYGFTPGKLLRYRQALVALAAALGLAAWRRRWRPLAFPLALFATALAVHLGHRPFWSYYYLHFAVPVAWLLGYAAGELRRTAAAELRGRPRRLLRGSAWALAASALTVAAAGYAGTQLKPEIERIRDVPRAGADAFVAAMKAEAPRTRWVFTRATMYAFQADLTVIPELAVLPKKRFWSGQVTQARILALVRRYRPEQLLLDEQDMADAEMARFTRDNYRPVLSQGGLSLWLRAGRDD